jgi:two-component system response regulator (stage 0 sporulation protein F)
MENRVLVVDDEENMLALLKRVLGKAGYRVSCANEGYGALELASKHRFRLAIVDVSMPGMDGIEVLRRLKGIDRELPVIMISAFASWDREQRARSLGCAGYFPKPLNMKHFKRAIRKSVERKLA